MASMHVSNPEYKAHQIHITFREKQVLHLLNQGNKSEEIAHSLQITLTTVRTHERHLRKKFGVNNRVKLLREASGLGLI